MSKRIGRVAELIQREIALIMQKQMRDPRLQGVQVVAVRMIDNLHLAKIYFILHDEQQRTVVEPLLKKAKGHIRHLLAESVYLRYTPAIEFVYDETIARAERITRLLDVANG